MDFAIKYLSDPVCPVFGPVRSRVCPFSYMLYILLQKDFHYSVFSGICQELILHGLQIGKDNIKCERKRKPPDALFFYLKSTEREVRTCETTDI